MNQRTKEFLQKLAALMEEYQVEIESTEGYHSDSIVKITVGTETVRLWDWVCRQDILILINEGK